MKTRSLTAALVAIILLTGCGKPSGSETTADSTAFAETPGPDDAGADREPTVLDRYLDNFQIVREGYPFIKFSRVNEVVAYHVTYYFEDDNLMCLEAGLSEEGGIAENFFVSRDPEGTLYLHYGLNIDGAFGYVGHDGGEWSRVKVDGNYKPYLDGVGEPDIFEYEIEFEEMLNFVRENKKRFKLQNGAYVLEEVKGLNDWRYEFSDVLLESNLLSETRFDPQQIAGYLNWWYPLYEDTPGTFTRHKTCDGTEYYIKIVVESGNYRWVEEGGETSIVYQIKGFEESEGDAFYATIERNGTRFKKTLINYEYEGPKDQITIDGRVYTSEPTKYDVVTAKCE